MTAVLCLSFTLTAFADETMTLEASYVSGDYGYNLNGDEIGRASCRERV